MATHYLRFSFLKKLDVYELDTDYETRYMKNMLQKIVGPYNLFEVELTEVLDEDYVPENPEDS